MSKEILLMLSAMELASKGYWLPRLEDYADFDGLPRLGERHDASIMPSDIIAIDLARERIFFVYVVTNKAQAFSLWMRLLQEERMGRFLARLEADLRKEISWKRAKVVGLVHKWSRRGRKYVCDEAELTSQDYRQGFSS